MAGAARARRRRRAHRLVAHPGLRGGVPGGDRRPRRGRGAELAGRGVRGRVAAVCCRAVAGSWRWARPTSATPTRSPRPYPGVGYRAFDLMRGRSGPDRQMLAELRGAVRRAVCCAPLPVTAWDVRRAPEAFRFLSQARHVGKVVLTVPPPWIAGRHGADHRWHGRSGCGGGPAPGHRARGPGPGAGQPAWPGRAGCRRSWSPSWPGSARQVAVVACDVADRDAAGRACWPVLGRTRR